MAIKFTDKDDGPKKPPKPDAASRTAGEAHFATPIETDRPVNPDTASELPFTELPPSAKKRRGKR